MRSGSDHRGAAGALAHLGMVACAQGDTPAALRLFGESLDEMLEVGPWLCPRCIVWRIAWATAHRQPERAVRLIAACEARYEAAYAGRNSGGMDLEESREERDDQRYPAEVRARMAEARAGLTAAEYAAAWSAGQTMTWPEAIQYARDTVDFALAATASGLTRRELEVLRLVASGMTDAQVADKLTISPRTVNTHLASIYGKLDVTTRTAAARRASERHLI
jgi:DNA-binding CsgD family transcriptional regulator